MLRPGGRRLRMEIHGGSVLGGAEIRCRNRLPCNQHQLMHYSSAAKHHPNWLDDLSAWQFRVWHSGISLLTFTENYGCDDTFLEKGSSQKLISTKYSPGLRISMLSRGNSTCLGPSRTYELLRWLVSLGLHVIERENRTGELSKSSRKEKKLHK